MGSMVSNRHIKEPLKALGCSQGLMEKSVVGKVVQVADGPPF